MALDKRRFCKTIPTIIGEACGTSITEVNYFNNINYKEIVEVVWSYKDGSTNRVLINVTCNSNLAILEEVLKEAMGNRATGRLSRVNSEEIFDAVDRQKKALDAIRFEERYCKNCDRYIECEVDGWTCDEMVALQEGYEV